MRCVPLLSLVLGFLLLGCKANSKGPRLHIMDNGKLTTITSVDAIKSKRDLILFQKELNSHLGQLQISRSELMKNPLQSKSELEQVSKQIDEITLELAKAAKRMQAPGE